MKIIQEGEDDFEIQRTCHACGTVFVVTVADLHIGRFKANQNTYWFDGSATAINKYYVECPHGCDIVFVANDIIPELAKRKAIVK